MGTKEIEELNEQRKAAHLSDYRRKKVEQERTDKSANRRNQYKVAIISAVISGLSGGLFGALFAWLFSMLHG